MKPEIKLLELFSGIGGFTLGLKRAGFKIKEHWFSEIDKHCVANYKYNFPDAKYIGSVTDVRGSGVIQPKVNPVQLGQSNQTFAAQYGTQIGEGDAFTIRASQPNGVKIESGIRRLTEIECERLQGFDKSWLDGNEPANWTKYGNYDGVIKEIPKTQRYKMCGNAVTVDVVECIGKRLLQ